MIETLGRSDWAAVSDRVAERLGPVFERGSASLGPNGKKMAPRALKKVSLSSSKSVVDVTTVVALLHVAGDDGTVADAADVLTAVPFTGDRTIFEPIREVFALAVRSVTRVGGDPSRFVARLTFAENDGEAAPPRMTTQLNDRLTGLLIKDNARDDHSVGSPTAHITNICIDVREFALMWSLGGSPSWPPARIDAELDLCAEVLRALKALP